MADQHLRSALRPVEAAKLPPGRKILPWGWWEKDFEPGTTLLWREQVQRKRAELRRLGRLKHDVDKRMFKEERRRMVYRWQAVENCAKGIRTWENGYAVFEWSRA